MSKSLEKWHLYSHAGCMDGSASAILFRHAGGNPKNIHWVTAGRVDYALEDSSTFRDSSIPILLVDIAPTTERWADQLRVRGNFAVIDHHASAKWLAGRPGFSIDVENTACGCELFRRWLVSQDIPSTKIREGRPEYCEVDVPWAFDAQHYQRICRIVDDHDRWRLQIPFSLEMPKFFSFVGQKDFVDRFMDVESRFGSERADYWSDFERDVVRMLERTQAQRFRGLMQKFQVRERDWEGRCLRIAYIVSAETNNSELLNLYLRDHPDVDAACQLNFDLQKVAYRSDGRVDLTRYCAQRGGGGHANAACHPFPEGSLLGVIDAVHSLL